MKHLYVFKLCTITTEASNGHNTNTQLKVIWDAPYNENDDLVAAIQDFTGRGFFCQVKD